ncbi:MAG: HipA domain-containing protein [Candidatus Limnocylindrales bacterium]
MPERLVVTVHGVEAGHLERAGRRSARFIPMPDGPALTVAASGSKPWTPELTRAWFEGLLPEGETRTRAAGRFGVQPEDWFALLAEIGWECAGAVAVHPEDTAVPDAGYRPLTDAEVGERLDALPGRPYDVTDSLRMSLGGAQDKMVLAWRAGSWALPVGGAPSTHILKPEPAAWPGLVAAEAWALALARSVTTAAEARPEDAIGSRPVVIVTRYDRRPGPDGGIERIHQEDLCQVLGLPPGDRYHEPPFRPHKPSLARLASLLLARGVQPTVELERLLRDLVVTLALGNADAHAKNWSLLHDGSGFVTLAPMYDIVPTGAFVPGQRFASLPVAGRFRIAEIGVEQILAEAHDWGLPERLARHVVAEALEGLRDGLGTVPYPGVSAPIRDTVTAGVQRLLADAVA